MEPLINPNSNDLGSDQVYTNLLDQLFDRRTCTIAGSIVKFMRNTHTAGE